MSALLMTLLVASPVLGAEIWTEKEGNIYSGTSNRANRNFLFNAEATKGYDVGVNLEDIVYTPQTGPNAGDLLVRHTTEGTTTTVSTPALTGHFWSEPHWAPGGQIIGHTNGGIYSINEDGSHLRRLSTFGEWRTMSIDGYLAFVYGNNDLYIVSPVKTEEEFGQLTHIFVPGVAGHNGIPSFDRLTNVLRMPTTTGLHQYEAHTGAETHFYPNIHDQQAVDTGNLAFGCEETGYAKEYKLSTEAPEFPSVVPCRTLRLAEYRNSEAIPPSVEPQIELPETLAEEFRPELRFDRNELWRPLDVDHFFASGDFTVCGDNDSFCSPSLLSVEELPEATLEAGDAEGVHLEATSSGPSSPFYISPEITATAETCQDVGFFVGESEELEAYATNECIAEPLASGLYYQPIGSDTEEHYLDYWAFYRYNHYEYTAGPVSVTDNHEGDWEHVFVALPPGAEPTTFDYVGFSAHGSTWEYLRDALTCDTSGASCNATGHRVIDYVASGSHANYPESCVSGCYETSGDEASPIPEEAFGGQVAWEQNNNNSVLKQFPVPNGWTITPPEANYNKDATWTDWPGLWGSSVGDKLGLGGSPASPGTQAEDWSSPPSAECSSRFSTGTCDAASLSSRGPDAIATPISRNDSAQDRDPCTPWEGPSVIVSVCNPSQLRQANAEDLFGQGDGSFEVRPSRSVDRFGATLGIAQVVGQPETSTQDFTIRGSVPKGTRVVVQVAKGPGQVSAVQAPLPDRKGKMLLKVARGPRHKVGLRLFSLHHRSYAGSRSHPLTRLYLATELSSLL